MIHVERFCKYSINEFLHFNTITTSRVEEGHRVLKSYLKCSTDDLLKMIDNLEILLKNQIRAYNIKLTQAKRKIPLSLNRELMRDLIAHVSSHALTKIQKQYKILQDAQDFENEALSPCTKTFVTTMGIPCSHVIKTRMKSHEGHLLLDDVHPH